MARTTGVDSTPPRGASRNRPSGTLEEKARPLVIRSSASTSAALLLCILGGCAGVNQKSGSGSGGAGASGGTPGSGGSGGAAGTGGSTPPPATGGSASLDAGPPPITDFPTTPVLDTNVPANAPALFGAAPRTTGTPCLTAPQAGTLMPKNWLRPRFEYTPTNDENLFEIQLSTASFADPYTIYTTGKTYTLDATLWSQLRVSVIDQPINVRVWAMTVSGSGTAQLAPSPAA